MFYLLIIVFGLITALCIFVQLYNETRAQKEQIGRLFEGVYVEISTVGDECNAPQIEPILSTSMTCGRRKNDNNPYRVDMPIYTNDIGLSENAAEFCIESQRKSIGKISRLYIRPLDQQIIWFGNPKKGTKKKVVCIDSCPKDKTVKRNMPEIFKDMEVVEKMKNENYRCLRIGDVVVMGNTRFEVKRGYTEDPQ